MTGTKAAALLSMAAAAIIALFLVLAPPESGRLLPVGERKAAPSESTVTAPGPAVTDPAEGEALPIADALEPSPEIAPPGPAAELAALDTLIGMGEGGISRLRDLLADSRTSQPEKLRAARALAAIGSHDALQALFDGIFAQSDASVRGTLVSALDSFGEVETVDSLVSLLTQPADPAIHAAVIDTVSRMAQARTVEYLGELCQVTTASSGETSPVLAALAAIRNEEATPALGALLLRDDVSIAARSAAATSLAKMGTKQSLTLLADAAGGASSPDEHSLQALASVQDPAAVPHLKSLLEVSGSPAVAQAVSHSLRAIETVHAPLH